MDQPLGTVDMKVVGGQVATARHDHPLQSARPRLAGAVRPSIPRVKRPPPEAQRPFPLLTSPLSSGRYAAVCSPHLGVYIVAHYAI